MSKQEDNGWECFEWGLFFGVLLTLLGIVILIHYLDIAVENRATTFGQMICDDQYEGQNTTYGGYDEDLKQVKCKLPEPVVEQKIFDGGYTKLVNWSD